MFIGHFAVALGAKKLIPKTNLGITFVACQLLDLIWPVLVLLGIETVAVEPGITEVTPLNFIYYPYSHSLLMALVWSVLLGAWAAHVTKNKKTGSVLGLVVLSHWILDFITHRPDLPLFLGDTKYGMGLWNSVLATLVVEGGLFAAGLFMYVSATRRPSKKSRWQFYSLIIFLLAISAGNLFGPQPSIDTPPAAIAGPALAMWLIVAWAYFADRTAHG
jgi:hypothetical protein